MAICARCFGSTIGHYLAFMLFLVGVRPALWFAILGIGLLLVDWSFQEFLRISSTNFRRLITGVIGGLGVGTLIWTAVKVTYLSVVG